MLMHEQDSPDWRALAIKIKDRGKTLGFNAIGISSATPCAETSTSEDGLLAWLAAGCHGEMDYMARYGLMRARPAELQPGTRSIISVSLAYWPAKANPHTLEMPQHAYISRYALGRDYHKLLRTRLKKLIDYIRCEIGETSRNHTFRGFSDSAPLLEVSIACRGGMGWRGKHTLLLTRQHGSLFFLGEILTNLPLPADLPQRNHCGTCRRCLDVCPTGAIMEPYRIDAKRCISYLTIEFKGSIPLALRPLIGNRIYGCDDCQLYCPWNTHPYQTTEEDFAIRHELDQAQLIDLFAWSADEFRHKMAGSAIYRIGHEQWLRNIAIGLGNAPTTSHIIAALMARSDNASALVREHVIWALEQHLKT